jgi:hypothetical protein
MTVEMAADCVKACNNAGDPDVYNAPIHLFEHFVEYFGWNGLDSDVDRWRIETFAAMCGFGIVQELPNG